MDGGCACGLVRYRLEKQPMVVHCCHCTSCQRETGTAFAINAIIESSMVTSLPSTEATTPASCTQGAKPAGPPLVPETGRIVEPEIITTPSESGKGQKIARCPTCHVAVWSNYGGAGGLARFIRVGSLDEAWKINPDVHIYTQSKRSFFSLGDSIPQYERFYPNREAVWRKESLARFTELLQQRD